MKFFKPLLFTAALALLAACAPATETATQAAAPTKHLSIDVFTPDEGAIFDVSSVLVKGKRDAILIDAQFSAADARQLANLVKASGKRLTTIYISHGDPDFYFGLETLHAIFPDAQILATPHTIAHIQATQKDKLTVWGPALGDNAPTTIPAPSPLTGDTLLLEGQPLKIIGLTGPTPDRTVVWIPSIRAVVGGIPVLAGEHVWMADTQTPESHQHWLNTLHNIEALNPVTVIPGHFTKDATLGLDAVKFTADYIRAFDEETARASNSAELIAAMKKRYPHLAGVSSLELSAKVATGEMQWH